MCGGGLSKNLVKPWGLTINKLGKQIIFKDTDMYIKPRMYRREAEEARMSRER